MYTMFTHKNTNVIIMMRTMHFLWKRRFLEKIL